MRLVVKPPTMRTRTKGEMSSMVLQWATWTLPAAAVYNTATVNGVVGETKQMRDVVTPGFKAKSSRGEVTNSPMWSQKITRLSNLVGPQFKRVSVPPGTDSFDVHTAGPWVAGYMVTANIPLAGQVDFENQKALARTRAWANIDQPDYQGLVFLGELRETLTMLRSPLKSILSLSNAFDRRLAKMGVFDKKKVRGANFRKQLKIREELASVYLQFQYGVKPLLKDIANIVETAKPRLLPIPVRKTARAMEKKVVAGSFTQTEGLWAMSYTASYSYVCSHTIRCGILYQYDTAAMEQEKWGLRPQDVPLAVYQLMPLSFVADWIGNLGEFISAITPRVGVTVLCSWESYERDETLTRSVSGYSSPSYTLTGGGSGMDSRQVVTKTRGQLLGPSLAMKDITSLQNDISRLTSLAALVTQRLSGLSRNDPGPAYRRINRSRVRAPSDFSNL